MKQQTVQCDGSEFRMSNNETVKLLSVNPVGAYHVDGLVSGINVSFMLDTGASVSLLRANVWKKFFLIKPFYNGMAPVWWV